MTGGARFSLAGLVLLLAVAGCGRSFMQYAERAAWRHQAEVNCLKSGAVKISQAKVQVEPIEGPGVCGANFPLKVAALGDTAALGYAEELRPPGAIPNGSAAQMPRWPASTPNYGAAAAAGDRDGADAAGARRARAQSADALGARRARDRSGAIDGTGRRADVDPPAGRGRAGGRRHSRRRRAAAQPRIGAARARCLQRAGLSAATTATRVAAARADGQNRGGRPGRADAGGDACVSDRLRARPLGGRGRAAGGAALVRRAGHRDQTDLGLFVPRHGRRRH